MIILNPLCWTHTIILISHGKQPHKIDGRKQVSGGSKHVKTSIVFRLFRNNEHPFPCWSLFSISCTLPWSFFNIQCVSYQMVMMTSLLVSSRHLKYWMAYNDSMCLCRRNYYINLDVRCHFYIGGHSYFPSLLHSVSCSCAWLCLRTIFSFPCFYPVSLWWNWLLLLWDQLCTHLQHAIWLIAVPSIDYPFVSIPWLLCGTS